MKIPKNLEEVQCLHSKSTEEFDEEFLAELMISLWRLRKVYLSEMKASGVRESTKAYRILERLICKLEDKGLRLLEHTGEYYDEGMALRVIASEDRNDLNRNIILETFTPSIFLRDDLIHAGEVVVGKAKESLA